MQYNLTKKPKPFFTDINGVVKYADKYSNSVINAIIANIKIHKNPSTMYLIAENSLKYLAWVPSSHSNLHFFRGKEGSSATVIVQYHYVTSFCPWQQTILSF